MHNSIKKTAYFFCAHYYPRSYQLHARSRYESYYIVKEYEYTIFCNVPIKLNFQGALELYKIMRNKIITPFREIEFMCDLDEAPYVDVINPESMKYILDGLFPEYEFHEKSKNLLLKFKQHDFWFDHDYIHKTNLKIGNQLWYNLSTLISEYLESNFNLEKQLHTIANKVMTKLPIGCYKYVIGENLSIYDPISKRMMVLRMMANPSFNCNSKEDYTNSKYNFYEDYKHYKSTIQPFEGRKDIKEPFIIGAPKNPISRPLDYIWDKKKIGQTIIYAGYQYIPIDKIIANENNRFLKIPTIFLSQEVEFNETENFSIFENILNHISIITSLPEEIIDKNQYLFEYSEDLTIILTNMFGSFHSIENDLYFIIPSKDEYKKFFKFYIEHSYMVEYNGDKFNCIRNISNRLSLNGINIGNTLVLKRLFPQIYNLNQHLFDFINNCHVINLKKNLGHELCYRLNLYTEFYPPDISVVVPFPIEDL